MTLPNWLSLFRLAVVPLIVWALAERAFGVALALFLAAAVTDAVDGHLARRLDQRTVLGSYLDPLADKALVIASFVGLAWMQLVPIWLAVLVVGRDIALLSGAVLTKLFAERTLLQPFVISKANTMAQMMLVGIVLWDNATAVTLDALVTVLVLVVAGLTAGSAVAYLVSWLRKMTGGHRRVF